MSKNDTYRNEPGEPETPDRPTVLQAIKLGFDPWLRACGEWWKEDGGHLMGALWSAGALMGGIFVALDLGIWASGGERMPRAAFWGAMLCFVVPTMKWWMTDMYVRGAARWEKGKR